MKVLIIFCITLLNQWTALAFNLGIKKTTCNLDPAKGDINDNCDSLYGGICGGTHCKCAPGFHINALGQCVVGVVPKKKPADDFADLPFEYDPNKKGDVKPASPPVNPPPSNNQPQQPPYNPNTPGAYNPNQPGGQNPNQPGGYNPNQPGWKDPVQPGGYNPNQPGGQNPNQPSGYNPNQPGSYNPNQPGGYNPNQPGVHNPNQPGGYNPNKPGYNPNQPGYNPNQPGYNPNQPGYNPNKPQIKGGNRGGGDPHVGEKAGGGVGGLIGLLIIGCLIYFCCCKGGKRKDMMGKFQGLPFMKGRGGDAGHPMQQAPPQQQGPNFASQHTYIPPGQPEGDVQYSQPQPQPQPYPEQGWQMAPNAGPYPTVGPQQPPPPYTEQYQPNAPPPQ